MQRCITAAVPAGPVASCQPCRSLVRLPSLPPTSCPAAASDTLQAADGACSAALGLEPGNSKARYRRALVRFRLGRTAEALADLDALPADAADAAVVALRAQVEAKLQQRG